MTTYVHVWFSGWQVVGSDWGYCLSNTMTTYVHVWFSGWQVVGSDWGYCLSNTMTTYVHVWFSGWQVVRSDWGYWRWQSRKSERKGRFILYVKYLNVLDICSNSHISVQHIPRWWIREPPWWRVVRLYFRNPDNEHVWRMLCSLLIKNQFVDLKKD